ncbi:MAG: PIG-L family deacetylase [Cyclobacteriaceae bacterium]|nr:PIG-L family deacetylase [Cyclobacteriaceae bacterium]MDX5467163.1 PIG-L family deacetylase [Cyclobacteriaceae bacterium]
MIHSKITQGLDLFLFCLLGLCAHAQSIPSSQIFHELQKLKETRRVLYVAAHPDDENTRLIAYLVNGEHMDVAYLSLTRGDGGQNLIGKELGVELGQIRTQELLKARQTDGGKQFFTRAMDFGYSKNPSETLQNWEKEKVLADVVWAIRKFQPDIIITRFNTIPGVTHGHHTTSAILAGEAFALAGRADVFPEQLTYVKPWSPKRIFFNAYNFRGDFQPEEGKKYHAFEVGGFDPLLGKTYHQIAADSRTMHKSQGFGATAGTGKALDYIELVDGPDYSESPFEGVSNRWDQLSGGGLIESQIEQVLDQFDFQDPSSNVPQLLSLRKNLMALAEKPFWIEERIEKLNQLIFQSMGLEIELVSRQEIAFPGDQVRAELIMTNPSSIPVKDINLHVFDTNFTGKSEEIFGNQTISWPIDYTIPGDMPFSQPYWLRKPIDGALFSVDQQKLIGLPFSPDFVGGDLSFKIEDHSFKFPVQQFYKYNDQVDGEIKQPFIVVPEVDLSLSSDNVFLVPGTEPTVVVSVNFKDQFLAGELDFVGLDRSQFKILSIEDVAYQKKRNYTVSFLPNGVGKKVITARFKTPDGRSFDQISRSITYKHIPNLTYFSPASINLIQADWKVSQAKIGYIPGAGDDVPGVLTALGYKVSMIGEGDYSVENLSQYKAIVVGIRAYNTNEALAANQQILLGYVRAGGNLIVQYNTSSPLLTNQIGPYPFVIGRDRVTVQESPVEADWSSSLLSSPNKVNAQDFEGWVQERGLYFATQIDSSYQTPLLMKDPDEDPTKGALIHGKYGDGNFVYTGISFFRQLPAGVTGAIKLFINLIEQ